MKLKLNEKYLINCDDWFVAPDGQSYKAVFGTVTAIESDEAMLGIKTNRGSTNWYIVIGDMVVAGCQIHFCIKTNNYRHTGSVRGVEYEGRLVDQKEHGCRIYNADDACG